MDVIDELIARAAGAEPWDAPREAAPAMDLAVLTCMDARIEPLRVLGLGLGDALVLRNAGGVVTDDVLRSLELARRRFGTHGVMVVHHTRCAAVDAEMLEEGVRGGGDPARAALGPLSQGRRARSRARSAPTVGWGRAGRRADQGEPP